MREQLDQMLGRIRAPVVLDADGRLAREVHWTSTDKRFVVVKGPFPRGFQRTTDSTDVHSAAGKRVSGILTRPATTRGDRYAKTRAEYITATHNEHGEIAP